MERRPAVARSTLAAALLLALAGLALAWLGSASAARLVKCGSKTIPVSITKTVPLTYTDTMASGVSCSWALRVFLPDISRAGAPTGWSMRVARSQAGQILDIGTHGKAEIVCQPDPKPS